MIKIQESESKTDMSIKLDDCQKLTTNCPSNAIILAAGFGMLMVPINLTVPKAILEVHCEPLIERQICQLHEAGINDIIEVVGFMREQFEYLNTEAIDKGEWRSDD